MNQGPIWWCNSPCSGHSSSCNTVLILGIGNGFLTSRLLTSLKSLTTCTVWSCFGTMNEGEAHSDSGCHFSTPNLQSLSASFLRVDWWTFGVGKGLPWYGFAPPSAWGRQSQCPNHLVFHQKGPQILWGASATSLDQERSGVCSCRSLLHWDLLFHA